jgi:hypothetical protein
VRPARRGIPGRRIVAAAGALLLLDLLAVAPPSSAGPPAYLTQWGGYGSGSGELILPTGVAVSAGRVYVTDYGNHRIQKFGVLPTATRAASWGRIKSGYR